MSRSPLDELSPAEEPTTEELLAEIAHKDEQIRTLRIAVSRQRVEIARMRRVASQQVQVLAESLETGQYQAAIAAALEAAAANDI